MLVLLIKSPQKFEKVAFNLNDNENCFINS